MIKLLRRIGLFLIPVILFILVLELSLGSEGVLNSNRKKKNAIKAHQDSVEILFMGSSQSLKGINPKFISAPSFNFANVSQSFYLDFELLKKYASEMPKLKKVFLAVSYHSFFTQLSDSEEAWREDLYTLEYKIPASAKRSFVQQNSYFTIYGLKATLKIITSGFQYDLAKRINKNGYENNKPLLDSSKVNDSVGEKRIEYHHEIMKRKWVNTNISTVEKMIEFLQEKDIKVYLYTTPTTAHYRKFQAKEYSVTNDSITNLLSNKYNIPYFDFENSNIFTWKDFNDTDHTNDLGAEKFSKLLNQVLQNY
ncbi:MAG: hypothetical protein N4A45_11805 [Flavobacteriales bacterium]|jgi:hypothetical protein|nr:hypothetical protein [Flavobacteriales bacterium]